MDTTIFVQNIRKYCAMKGVKPTVAFQESGVGKSFISNMVSRGSEPTLGKVTRLAEYLGVTTSDLLGEKRSDGGKAIGLTQDAIELIDLYDQSSPELQAELLGFARGLAAACKSRDKDKGA